MRQAKFGGHNTYFFVNGEIEAVKIIRLLLALCALAMTKWNWICPKGYFAGLRRNDSAVVDSWSSHTVNLSHLSIILTYNRYKNVNI